MRVKQLVEIEHRRDFAADLGERLERVGVAPAALEQPRVDQRHRDVRRELPEDRRRRAAVNWSRLRLRMLSAPIGRDLCSSGTTTAESMPGTNAM